MPNPHQPLKNRFVRDSSLETILNVVGRDATNLMPGRREGDSQILRFIWADLKFVFLESFERVAFDQQSKPNFRFACAVISDRGRCGCNLGIALNVAGDRDGR
jgi:hypothetical protein